MIKPLRFHETGHHSFNSLSCNVSIINTHCNSWYFVIGLLGLLSNSKGLQVWRYKIPSIKQTGYTFQVCGWVSSQRQVYLQMCRQHTHSLSQRTAYRMTCYWILTRNTWGTWESLGWEMLLQYWGENNKCFFLLCSSSGKRPLQRNLVIHLPVGYSTLFMLKFLWIDGCL